MTTTDPIEAFNAAHPPRPAQPAPSAPTAAELAAKRAAVDAHLRDLMDRPHGPQARGRYRRPTRARRGDPRVAGRIR